MLRTFRFRGFIEPARRGITRPIIIWAQDGTGKEETLYLKTLAGYADRPQAAGVELFTTLLARRLGLKAPEPVVVEVPERAGRFAHDAPDHAGLLNRSPGLNFATVALGSDWKVWLPQMSVRNFPDEAVADALAFDGLAQHTDREAENPNLLWKGAKIAVVDHEKVFGYLKQGEGQPKPWRAFFQSRPFARHVLHAAGKRLAAEPDFGKAVWESLLELEHGGELDSCQKAAEAAFPAATVDLARIRAYLSILAAEAGDFFDHLRASLQR